MIVGQINRTGVLALTVTNASNQCRHVTLMQYLVMQLAPPRVHNTRTRWFCLTVTGNDTPYRVTCSLELSLNSVVSIATRYGLVGLGLESAEVQGYSVSFQAIQIVCGTHSASCVVSKGFISRGQSGRGVNLTTHFLH
jgi:hypothetical protein